MRSWTLSLRTEQPERAALLLIVVLVALALPAAGSSDAPRPFTIPLHFEPAAGPAGPSPRFVARGQGWVLQLAKGEAWLGLAGPQGPRDVLHMRLEGSRPAPKTSGVGELTARSHYFLGSDPSRWRTGVPHYSGVRYGEVYPETDLRFYGKEGLLEYDFDLAPGADPAAVRLVFEGAEQVGLDAAGDLVLRLSGGEVRMHRPVAYQEGEAGRQPVRAGFVLLPAGRVGFDVGPYDPRRTLVIDPVLGFSTYLGGSGADTGLGIARDAAGNVYITGSTSSPALPGADPADSPGGGLDAFVAKLDATGKVVYVSYLGGSFDDRGYALDIDGAQNVYVTGSTFSQNFPVASPLQAVNGGGAVGIDAFAACLSADGGSLLYSTYLGGNNSDEGRGIAVSAGGDAYITGYTMSAGVFGVLRSPHGNNNADAFLLKLAPSGTVIGYLSYLGGSGEDMGLAVALASPGSATSEAYVSGRTASSDFPVAGGFQTTFGGGSYDAFMARLTTAGAISYSTFLGGYGQGMTGWDEGRDVAVDSSGYVYVTGYTTSTNFPTTSGAFQTSPGGGSDAFLTKLYPRFTGHFSLIYSSFFGGSNNDEGNAVAVDLQGQPFIAGTTISRDLPLLGSLQASHGGGVYDGFLARLNGSASRLLSSTFLGGSGDDGVRGMALDAVTGTADLVGSTASSNFPLQMPFQGSSGGGEDVFITRIVPAFDAVADFSIARNPSGAWVYGHMDAPDSLFYYYVLAEAGASPGLDIWRSTSGLEPNLSRRTGSTLETGSVTYPTDMLHVQPGPGWEHSGIFWTAPTSGRYRILYALQGLHHDGAAADFRIFLNGNFASPLVQGDVRGYGPASRVSGVLSQTVAAGDTVAVVVGPGDDGLPVKDVTGLALTILPEEPGTFTPAGTGISVQPVDTSTGTTPVTVLFSTVTVPGSTSLTTSRSGPTPPSGLSLGDPPVYYELRTTSVFSGSVEVCVDFSGVAFAAPSEIRLYHQESGIWVDRTTSLDTASQVACATVWSLSPFALFEPEPPPSISIADGSRLEGSSGATLLSFSVHLSAATSRTVTVNYSTSAGTATAGTDYTETSGTLTFLPGETGKTIAVPVAGDTLDEVDETFTVSLSNPSNATLSDGQAQGTILDDDAAPALSIADVSTVEGNSGTSTFLFAVSLSAASSRTVTVNYATSAGTATAGTDYTETSGTLTFLPGETGKTIAVPVVGDTLDEVDETFTVSLSNPSNATLSDGEALGTILDDDTAPALSIADVSAVEGNSGTSTFLFAVSLSAASSRTVTVNYATSAGTATAGTDYIETSGTLTFLPGETGKTIAVSAVGDTLDEVDETFTVSLSNLSNATLSDGQAQGTILDDDAAPALSIADVSTVEGNSGTSAFLFAVSLSAASSRTVTVNYATSAGTATAGTDYTETSGSLTFLPGETGKTIAVPVVGDTLDEVDETFTVSLSNPSNATLSDGQAQGTILDDDAAPALSIADVSTVEGNSGTSAFLFAVSLSAASSRTVTVNYATSAGTATAGTDYTETSGSLTFLPGETGKTIAVPVVGDTLDEVDETFTVSLSNPSNATLSDGQAQGTILDDDAAPTLSIADVSTAEGNSGASFAVSLSAASSRTVTVNYATSAGTATAGTDYTETSGTLTFLPGETGKTIAVPVVGDTLDEVDETFTVSLSNPSNATLSDGEAQGTILDDDAAPALSIADVSTAEGSTGTSTFLFTVSLSAASSRTVTVNYATSAGTATAGTDYTETSGTLTFLSGETGKTIAVPVVGDTLDEVDETFTVSLSNPSNATLSDGEAQGTILDDDAAPALSIADVSTAEGNTGTSTFLFTVSLSAASSLTVTVNYATSAGTATAGTDYTETPGTLTFLPGETGKTIAVPVMGDTLDEVDEMFTVSLSNPSNATQSDGEALGTILDDDLEPLLSVGDAETTEGQGIAVFVVSLSAPSSRAVSVGFGTQDGTALGGLDYIPASGTLTFPPGSTQQQIGVTLADDHTHEDAESFLMRLQGPAYATLADAEGAATILDDDLPVFTGPTSFYTLAPCRVLDTRQPSGPFGGPAIEAGVSRSFALAGRCGIPDSATAVSANLTVVMPTAAGYLRAYPGNVAAPLVSSINFSPGQVRANNGLIALAADGQGTLVIQAGMLSGSVHVLLDVNGYFE